MTPRPMLAAAALALFLGACIPLTHDSDEPDAGGFLVPDSGVDAGQDAGRPPECPSEPGPESGPWVRCSDGLYDSPVLGAVTNDVGEIYVTGYFAHFEVAGVRLDAEGSSDVLLAKLDRRGNVLWAKRFGGGWTASPVDAGKAIALMPDGDVVIGGTFRSPLDFGNGYVFDLPNWKLDLFVARFSPAGEIRWARPIYTDGLGEDDLTSLAVDPATGSIYLTGRISGRTGGFPGNGGFLIRMKPTGEEEWQLAGDLDPGRQVVVDEAGNAIWFAENWKATRLGGVVDLPVAGDFVAKVDPTGQVIWARHFPDRASTVLGIGALPGGRVAVLGYVSNSNPIDLGNGVFARPDATLFHFRADFDAAGTALSSHNLGLRGADPRAGSRFTPEGDLIVAGAYAGSNFCLDGATCLPVEGTGSNGYVARFDSAGKVRWSVLQDQGTPSLRFYALAVDPFGDLVVGGTFSGLAEIAGAVVSAPQTQDRLLVWKFPSPQ